MQNMAHRNQGMKQISLKKSIGHSLCQKYHCTFFCSIMILKKLDVVQKIIPRLSLPGKISYFVAFEKSNSFYYKFALN